MNADQDTFARFSRRFAAIEEQIPARSFSDTGERGRLRARSRVSTPLAGVVLVLVVIAIRSFPLFAPGSGGPITSEAGAVRLARTTSGLVDPITIIEVESGSFESLIDGPPPFTGTQRTPEQLATLARPAWHVVIRGVVPKPCADSKALLPCGLQTLDYIFDAETGAILYAIMPG